MEHESRCRPGVMGRVRCRCGGVTPALQLHALPTLPQLGAAARLTMVM